MHFKRSLSELKITCLLSKKSFDLLGGKTQKLSSKNPLSVGVFVLCFLFSFNSFAIGGRFLKLIRSEKSTDSPAARPHQPTTFEEMEAFNRQRHIETTENIRGISERAVHHLARDIDEKFKRTLDEILETRNINALPGDMLDELRAATTDPLRLFDLDNPPGFANAINFNLRGLHDSLYNQLPPPGQVTEEILAYRDIYRAFFQKRLDPENSQQMYRLRNLLDRIAEKFKSDTYDPYETLRFLFKHDGFEESAYKSWSEELMETLFRDDVFKSMADNCFKDGFDEKNIFYSLGG